MMQRPFSGIKKLQVQVDMKLTWAEAKWNNVTLHPEISLIHAAKFEGILNRSHDSITD